MGLPNLEAFVDSNWVCIFTYACKHYFNACAPMTNFLMVREREVEIQIFFSVKHNF